MQFNASQIASFIHGSLEGNPDVMISEIAKIEDASQGSLSFVANPKYEPYLYETDASIVIVNKSFQAERPVSPTLIRVDDAYAAFALLMDKYSQLISGDDERKGIEQPAYISDTASLGQDVYIGAFSYIGKNVKIGNKVKIFPGTFIGDNVQIGNNSTINAGVKIYHNSQIGSQVIIHAGVVIGGDGFGFAHQKDGSYKKVPQLGNVVIEDHVEIGANTTIDRATMGSTIIRKGVKLDNLIQIAHNVEIGEGTVIAAQTGISGSTKIGKHCVIGGQVGIVGHIQIADGTKINAQSGLSKSVTTPDTALTGSPAFDYKSSLRSQAIFRNLPSILERIEKLEKMLKNQQG